jgi:transcriptional regulator with XRE-family HTH domain
LKDPRSYFLFRLDDSKPGRLWPDMGVSHFQRLGATLRGIREEKGLTLEEAGRLAGVDYSSLGRYERGDVEPSLRTLGRILEAYRIDVSELGERMGRNEIGAPAEAVAQPEADPFLEAVRGALKRLGYGAPGKDADRAEES